MEATFKLYLLPVVMVTKCTEHTRSRNMGATLKGNPKTKYGRQFERKVIEQIIVW